MAPASAVSGRMGGVTTPMDRNLLSGPPPTLLPEDPARSALEAGADPRAVAAAHPTSSLAWAVLADQAYADGNTVESYAYARVGYHLSLIHI